MQGASGICLQSTAAHLSYVLQMVVLQTLADERCLQLLPPLHLAPGTQTSYTPSSDEDPKTGVAPMIRARPFEKQRPAISDSGQLQRLCQELLRGNTLDRCSPEALVRAVAEARRGTLGT